ncbi:MAG TPA: PorT family protein [Bacteroidetes bacterium]|nr:PorT family protein [Bacteroidota bacterium]
MGNKDKNIVDRLFEDRLKNASMTPPASMWEGIAADLENDRLRKKVAYWRFIAAAIVLVFLTLGGTAAIYYGITGQGKASLVSNEVISLPYGNVPATSGAGQKEMALAQPSGTELGTASSNALSAPLNQTDNVRAVQLTREKAANIRRILRDARQNHMKDMRKAGSMPIVLTTLNPGSISLSPKHPAFGLRNNTAQAQFAEPQPEIKDTPSTTELAFRKKKTPRRLRKERPGLDLFADGNTSDKRKKRKWAIGGSFSPNVAFATGTPVNESSLSASAKVTLPDDPSSATLKQSSPVATFTTGLRGAMDLTDRLSLQSGIQYTRRSTTVVHEAYESGGHEHPNNFNLSYLEIPLKAKYKLLAISKLDWFVASGISGNLFLDYKQELQTESGRIDDRKVSQESEILNPSQASFLLSTGLQYRIKDQISLHLEPGFRYGFLTSRYSFTAYDPISLSLATGVNFHF